MDAVIGILGESFDTVASTISIFSGPKIDSARNNLFKEWMKDRTEYLLMLDTDMVPPRDIVKRLMAHKKDIVGGLCFSGGMGSMVRPTLHVVRENSEGKPYMDILWDYPRGELVQVDGTGAAAMLIHRNVAEGVLMARGEDHMMPWFAHGMHNGVEIGEDIAFCLTAAKCGFETWVDTSVVVPHIKTTSVDEHSYVASLNNENHPRYAQRADSPAYRDLWPH